MPGIHPLKSGRVWVARRSLFSSTPPALPQPLLSLTMVPLHVRQLLAATPQAQMPRGCTVTRQKTIGENDDVAMTMLSH